MTTPSDEWRTAIHEAGHMVCYLSYGFAPKYVTIEADAEANGHVLSPHQVVGYEGGGQRERQRRAVEGIIGCYAGLAAEHVCCGVPFSFDEGAEHGAWDDDANAWSLLCDYVHVRGAVFIGDDRYDAKLERLRRDALRFCKANAPTIERVARAILERRTLTGADVERIMRGSQPES